MDILDTKHESLRALVAEVLRHLPEADLMVLDWWDSDPYAIAFALRSAPERRAYVSSVREIKGTYLLSCEFTADRDSEREHNIESDAFTKVDGLATAIAQHLLPA